MFGPPGKRVKTMLRKQHGDGSCGSSDAEIALVSAEYDVNPHDYSYLEGNALDILSSTPSQPNSAPSDSCISHDFGLTNVDVPEFHAMQTCCEGKSVPGDVCDAALISASVNLEWQHLRNLDTKNGATMGRDLLDAASSPLSGQPPRSQPEIENVFFLECLSSEIITPLNLAMGPALNFPRFMETFNQQEYSPEASQFETVQPEAPDQHSSFESELDLRNHHNFPLYEGSNISVSDCMVSILSYAQSAHISGKSTIDLLELLQVLLPQPNNLPKTAHMFTKYFKNDNNEIQTYFFCSGCYKSRQSAHDCCNECTGSKSKVNYFVVVPLSAQLQRLYNRPGFREKLKYRFSREKKNKNNIEDVYDGSIYRDAEKAGFLQGENDISLTMNTDGVAIYECSTYSLWPCMFTINELPPGDRHKAENVLIGGLWGGDGKPHPNVFLLPQYHELKKLNEGISVKVFGSDEEAIVRAVLLICTCDVPAKSAFMNMKTHCGYYSCSKCFIQGEKSERTGNVLVFPHEDNLVLRNDDNYKECINFAVLSKDGYKGVFGPTILSYMFSTSFIEGMTIDVMHCVYMGITKQFLKLWFDVKYKEANFSLYEKIPQVNGRLHRINLPHFVQRVLLEVDKSLSFWKASLCRNFLLYVVLILLKGLLPARFLNNICMFVEGISLLNSDSISSVDLERAEKLLFSFCKDFEILYGVRHMSYNIHMVRHLSKCVSETGNLFVNSCFKFEDLNGQLGKLVHGTRHAIKQITTRLQLVTDLPLLIDSVKSNDVKDYCTKLLRRLKNFKLGPQIGHSVYIVGECTELSPHFKCVDELLSILFTNVHFVFFERLYKDSCLYVSHCYGKGSRISCYCRYQCDGRTYHGLILTFVKTDSNKYYALLDRSYDIHVGFHRYVQFVSSGDKDLIRINDLLCVSFCLDIDEHKYLIDPVNFSELE